MSIIEHRLSSVVVSDDWLSPDERNRDLDEDYEAGPVALNDTSEGLSNQVWHLTYDIGGTFTVTPETTGSPVDVLTGVSGVTQCSLAFDQNAHVNIAYTLNTGAAYLYWYDSLAAGWVTDQLDSGTLTPTLTLDDKRTTQTDSNDILLWYLKKQPNDTYNVYTREQRDRFLIEYPMGNVIGGYIYKLGMHKALRVQVGISNRIL